MHHLTFGCRAAATSSSRNNPGALLHQIQGLQTRPTQRTTGKRTAQLQHNVLPAVHAHGARHAPRLARRGEPAPTARRPFGDSLRGTPAPNTSPPARATVKSSRRKSGSFDDDDDDESGRRSTWLCYREHLEETCNARSARASWKCTRRASKRRCSADARAPAIVRTRCPKARHPSQTDLHKRKAHNALHPRDLRAVDATNPHACKNPSVVVRQHVIVCNFPPLRCVVVGSFIGVIARRRPRVGG